MRNTLVIIILAIGLTAFFGFTNNSRWPAAETNEYRGFSVPADTVPAKKDTAKWKSKKTPYDSFGKPKTMDSSSIK